MHLSQTAALTAEKAIRDQAATILNHIKVREDHPSFGYTKTGIKHEESLLRGMCGLYSMLMGQANHATAGYLADFIEDQTKDRVTEVRQAVQTL